MMSSRDDDILGAFLSDLQFRYKIKRSYVSILVLRLLVVQLSGRGLWWLSQRILRLFLLALQAHRVDQYRCRVLPHLRLRWMGVQLLLLGKRVLRARISEGVEQSGQFWRTDRTTGHHH